MSLTQEQVLEVTPLRVRDPDLHQDIVALGFVKDLVIRGGEVDFTIELTTPACPVKDQMKAEAEEVVGGLPGRQGGAGRDDGGDAPGAAPGGGRCPVSRTCWRWAPARAAWARARSR